MWRWSQVKTTTFAVTSGRNVRLYMYKYHGSPATMFNRLVYEPSFFKQGFIIIQKELLFSKWMVDFQGISNNLKPIDNLGFEFSQW